MLIILITLIDSNNSTDSINSNADDSNNSTDYINSTDY